MSDDKKIIFSIIVAFFFLFGLVLYLSFFDKKAVSVVYVDNQKVFEEFNMTRDILNKSQKQIRDYTKEVDSLYLMINDLTNKSKKEVLVAKYVQAKERLEYFSTNFAQQESHKIWERIGSYGEEFSKSKNYDLILGKQPNENIIYGNENINVTNDFIIYINSKYEGH